MAWDDDDKWRYDHTAQGGHRVDSKGYDEKGTYWGNSYFNTPKNDNSNTTSSSGTGSTDMAGIGSLIGIGIVGFILYKVYMFIKANWVSIVTIFVTCVVCTIICFILHKKAKKAGLKMLFTILAAVGIIGTVLYSGPRETEAFFVNLQQMIPKLEKKAIQEPTITPTSIYAYVIPDALNIRSGPSVNYEIVGQLFKDHRVEISDNSAQWWKIKFENIEGYVDSDFLRSE